MKNSYELKLENDQLLMIPEFVEFCVTNQNQDITLQVNNEGHCLSHCGVYDILDQFKFNSVEILTANILEKHSVYKISYPAWFFWFTNIQKFDFDYDYTWNQKKVFGCIYGRPSAPRLGLASFLAEKHQDKSLIVCKFDFSTEDSRKMFDLERLFSWDPGSLSRLPILNDQNFFTETHYEKGRYSQSNTISHTYKDFLIDIVSEPVCQGNSFYPTEKIVRAMLCKRPFIVMASENYLDYLHQMGFHSFNEFWSEEYDAFEGKIRYEKILQLIDEIAKKTPQQLLELYYSMTFQIEHNYSLIVEQSYSTQITQI